MASDHYKRWIDVCLGRTNKNLFAQGRSNVYASGDMIYSYGSHFEMARLLRDGKGKPRAFLLNGDRYSSTTSGHQGNVRRAVASSGMPSVIIPYSALVAASVNLDTVEIIEATKDRHIETKHVVYEQPEGTRWVEVDDYGDVDLTTEELEAKVAQRNAREAENHKFLCERGETNEYWAKKIEAGPRVITVDDLSDWDRRERRVVGTHMELQWSRRAWGGPKVEILDDGRTKYSWTTHRHLLGESLVRTRIDGRNRWERCSCATGMDSDLSCKKCNGNGGRTIKSPNRWAYFLSGFDHNEAREVYFFCELPKGVSPTTVAEAYEDLKPDAVKIAEQMGRTIYRQGDIFAIEMRHLTKRVLRTRGATFAKRGNLLRTNHEATEVAYLPDGSTLVRGTLWHNPRGRQPDHRRVTVGKSWHLAVKNRVPVVA